MSDFRAFAMAVALVATAMHVSLAVYKSHQATPAVALAGNTHLVLAANP